jgi:hypothetical protein
VTDKRRVRRSIKDLQYVKTWQLVVLLVLAAFLAATFLRLNNIGMVERRAAVIAADESGDRDQLIQRLYDLQQYVAAHMNTDMGKGVYLETSYNNDYQKWQQSAYGEGNPNGNIYQRAEAICAAQFASSSAAFIQCTTSEIAKYPAASDPASDGSAPRADSYRHVFASPLWSPDIAGWSVVVCIVLVLLIITRLVTLGILRLMLRRHYKSV